MKKNKIISTIRELRIELMKALKDCIFPKNPDISEFVKRLTVVKEKINEFSLEMLDDKNKEKSE